MPRVSIADTDKVFDVKENEVIYDALCDRGEILPHGCLAGSCGACKIDVVEGIQNLAPSTFIENNTLEAIKDDFEKKYGKDFLTGKNIRLACRARVKGDVAIKSIK